MTQLLCRSFFSGGGAYKQMGKTYWSSNPCVVPKYSMSSRRKSATWLQERGLCPRAWGDDEPPCKMGRTEELWTEDPHRLPPLPTLRAWSACLRRSAYSGRVDLLFAKLQPTQGFSVHGSLSWLCQQGILFSLSTALG